MTATSSANAVGLWQFMSGTARGEGLEVSDYVDERRDPYRATDAAIRHLTGLHNEFNSWYPATVLRAVAKAAGSTTGQIRLLNPQFLRDMSPPDRESLVRVPMGAGAENS